MAEDALMGTTPPPPGQLSYRLQITVWTGPGGEPTRWTLTGDPPGGDHPDPAAARAALAGAARPFAPVPPGTMCTQIYGGPQTATIDGVWAGQPVRASYSRVDGCEIARWNALAAVFQPG
jgi:hypothetical protein